MAGPSAGSSPSSPSPMSGKLLIVTAALLLGMDVLSTVVAPPALPAAPAATSKTPAAAAGGAAAAGTAAAKRALNNNLPPGLHVSLCTACSYKGYYNQLAAELSQRYGPALAISAAAFPPSLARRAAAGAATAVQAAGLAVSIGGDRLFPALGFDSPPRWYEERVKPRRTGAALAAWFFPNLVRQAAEGTGAFEVFLDGEPIFSKLGVGRFPSADELSAAIDKRMPAAAAAAAAGAGFGGGDEL